jgi:hypothetical protein
VNVIVEPAPPVYAAPAEITMGWFAYADNSPEFPTHPTDPVARRSLACTLSMMDVFHKEFEGPILISIRLGTDTVVLNVLE